MADFSFLSSFPMDTVVNALKSESVEICTIAASQMSRDTAAKVLPKLGAEKARYIVKRLADLKEVQDDILDVVAGQLKQKCGTFHKTSSPGGLRKVAGIIGKMADDSLMQDLKKEDPLLFDQILEKMVSFENVFEIADRDLQTLLSCIDYRDMALAFKGLKSEQLAILLKNVSKRQRDLVIDEMQSMGTVKRGDVDVKRHGIVQKARSMEEQGQLIFSSGEVVR